MNMGNMREISVEECNAVFGGFGDDYNPGGMPQFQTPWNTYSYDNYVPGSPSAIGVQSGTNGGEGYHTESGLFVAPDGKVYKDFQSCVENEAQNARDEAAELLASFGPIGAVLAKAYSEQGPNRQQENAGINECHGAIIVRPNS
jgi:hypothetical protein